ncbi:MAG: hypothetical protein V5A33_02360, partial [Halobacteriales archaeon]
REVADRIGDGNDAAATMADRIVAFFEDESTFGGPEGTAVDAIVGTVDGEGQADEQPGDGGGEST